MTPAPGRAVAAADDAPLLPSAVAGLRAWRVVVEADGAERLAGPQGGPGWPAGGAWLQAACARGGDHAAPDPGCTCGIHAWHPRPAAARAVLAGRGEVAGVVEVTGAGELHEAGLRAAAARPRVLFVAPRANAARLARLAAAYDARLVPVRGPQDVLAFCAQEDLGLSEATVVDLLGPAMVARAREQRRRDRRRGAVRLAAAAAIGAALVAAGLGLARDPSGDHTLYGRAGEVHVHRP
jgi:hypothetical protein